MLRNANKHQLVAIGTGADSGFSFREDIFYDMLQIRAIRLHAWTLKNFSLCYAAARCDAWTERGE